MSTPPQNSPFWVALYETDSRLEAMIAISAAVHILTSLLVIWLSKDSWVTAKLRQKQSPAMAGCLFAAYVVGFVHAVIVSVSAILVVVYERYEVWPLTIALSIGYFISDFIFFALPTKQPVMVIHHIVMIVGHYPTMELPAATLYGAGDAHLIMWLSAVGYLTEISNLFLDVRWFQLKVFEGPPAQWSYALNSLFLLVSYIFTRVVIMPVVRAARARRACIACARLAEPCPTRSVCARRSRPRPPVASGCVAVPAPALRSVRGLGPAGRVPHHRGWCRLHQLDVGRVHIRSAQGWPVRLFLLQPAQEEDKVNGAVLHVRIRVG
jgi:hypothetical protein